MLSCCSKHLNSEVFVSMPESFERPPEMHERDEGARINIDYAKLLLERLLKQPHAKAYFGMNEAEVGDLRRVILGRSPNSSEAIARYEDLIRQMMELPMREPHIIIPDTEHEGWAYLVLNDGKERRAELSDGKFFLLHEIKLPEEITDFESRIQALATTSYFPEFKIIEEDGKTYLGVEFVDGTYPERGADVHEFLEACQRINFGPDTNVTNFKQTQDGDLKYVDWDVGEWLISPSKHPYIEGSYAIRNKTW